MTTGTALVTSTVDRIAAGDIRPVEQQHIDESTLRPAPKIFKEDCRIDWTLPGRRIADFIRGLSPYPAAWTEMFREEDEEPQSAKVFSATFEAAAHGQPCGTVESDGRTFILRGVRRRMDRSRRVADSRQETARGARPAAGLARREPIPIQEITRFSVAKPSHLFRQPPPSRLPDKKYAVE